ncbi:GPN-loop GTPase 2 isoform X2 [Macrobrachium rosenbergii]|uniref:GPN-loop GTPase 2 isoform X2 n=1 Tax=Macrobrachium rosenbergii TaxID=79674 RepID=UPI0034D61128
MVVLFGQVVLGPPGSGKTTYCKAVGAVLRELGRKVAIINLDPANDALPYEATIDINELIQAELYSHHTMVRNILSSLEKSDIRLCAAYLVDSHYASDPGKYISAVMLALNSMMMMEMPTVNILSKVDSVEKYGKTALGLEYYTEVMDLDYLIDTMNDTPVLRKYVKLNRAIAEVVTDYSLVSFIPMSVESHSTILDVIKAIDRANGYVYGSGEEGNIQRLLSCAVGAQWEHDRIGVARDEFMGSDEELSSEEEIIGLIAQQNQDRY